MKKEIADRWVAALRSGKFRQGTGYLHCHYHGTYCCLGVLCTLYDKDAGADDEVAGTWRDGQEVLPREVRDWADMASEEGGLGNSFPCLTALNDGFDSMKTPEQQVLALEHLDAMPAEVDSNGRVKLSFEEIANVIEAEYDQL